MNKLLLALLLALSANAYAQHPSTDSRWELVLNENFNSSSVNTSLWQVAGYVHGSKYDASTGQCYRENELSAYVLYDLPNNNVIVDDGMLSLYVRQDDINARYWCFDDNGNSYEAYFDVSFTSGMLLSKQPYKYGYFEAKFMMPENPTNGKNYTPFGPNFWLYEANCWNEIDIYENDHDSGPGARYTNAAHYTPQTSPCPDSYALYNTEHFEILNVPLGVWHTAACNWTPDKIDYYLDNTLVRTVYHDWINDLDEMYITLDINAPRRRGQYEPIQYIPLSDVNVSLPYVYKIDYVKVWQLRQDCDNSITYCNTPPTTATNTQTYQTITTGASGCTTTFSDYVSLKASDYILLNEGTTIPSPTWGNIQYIDVEGCMDY